MSDKGKIFIWKGAYEDADIVLKCSTESISDHSWLPWDQAYNEFEEADETYISDLYSYIGKSISWYSRLSTINIGKNLDNIGGNLDKVSFIYSFLLSSGYMIDEIEFLNELINNYEKNSI